MFKSIFSSVPMLFFYIMFSCIALIDIYPFVLFILFAKETIQYFRNVKKVELSMEGRLEFWNFWYVMILINDILIIIGSYMEGNISRNVGKCICLFQ